MKVLSKIIAKTIKFFYGFIIYTLCYLFLFHLYALLRLGILFFKNEYLVVKYAFINPTVGVFETIKYLGTNYWIFQKDGIGIIVAIAVLSLIVTLLLLYGKKVSGKGANNKKITRGPMLLTAKQLNKSFKSLVKQEAQEIYKDLPWYRRRKFSKRQFIKSQIGKPFLCSHPKEPVFIPEFVFGRHISFLGTTGVGKTTLIKQLINHSNSLGEKSIILDLNGELYSEVGTDQDIILSPFDTRSHKWDFCFEKSNGQTINASEFSKYIVPKGSDQNSFWWKGGRTVFTEVLEHYPSAIELWDAITDPSRDFRNHLSGLVENIIGKEGSNQDAGILGTLSSDLGFLKNLIALNIASSKEYISIAKWAQDENESNLFLIFSDKDFESIAPIIGMWINLAVLGRFDAGKDNKLPKMNIIIDEVGSLKRIDQLPNALARLRKYGGKVVLGLQSESQLSSIYSENDARAMKGNIGTRFIFRSPEEVEAKNLSKFLGRSEVINVGQNNSTDKQGNLYTSISESTSYKDIVLDSEITLLADGHYYLKSLNLSPAKLRIHKMRWDSKYPLHHEMKITKKATSRSPEEKGDNVNKIDSSNYQFTSTTSKSSDIGIGY
jgi:hypothetical protein